MRSNAAARFVPAASSVHASERLIVALNPRTISEAWTIVRELDGIVDFFKVGLQIQMTPGGDEFIDGLIKEGKRVFVDYKYYDISDTVEGAVSRAAQRGITFLTVHGNGEIIRAAVKAKGNSHIKIFAVTVLTSLDVDDLKDLYGDGFSATVMDLVLVRARNAIKYQADGVIASPEEASAIKALPNSGSLLVVTPGIRLDGSSIDDHKRVGSPQDAIMTGADYLVVGRPIINAPDRASAAKKYIDAMQVGFNARD